MYFCMQMHFNIDKPTVWIKKIRKKLLEKNKAENHFGLLNYKL